MIRKLLCFLSFHAFSEPEAVLYFETVCCERCKRKWTVDTYRQMVWEITR